tara:strand:+ start:219 stop:548 length:330 start_codon:yes stop_codon:yes gene_type:complete
MIDTDKYEGHTTDWEWKDKEWGVALCGGEQEVSVDGEICCDTPDGNLAQDAPLLLAEVKRLNKVITLLKKNDLWVSQEGWEESDKDDELLVSMYFLIDKALQLRGDFND